MKQNNDTVVIPKDAAFQLLYEIPWEVHRKRRPVSAWHCWGCGIFCKAPPKVTQETAEELFRTEVMRREWS